MVRQVDQFRKSIWEQHQAINVIDESARLKRMRPSLVKMFLSIAICAAHHFIDELAVRTAIWIACDDGEICSEAGVGCVCYAHFGALRRHVVVASVLARISQSTPGGLWL